MEPSCHRPNGLATFVAVLFEKENTMKKIVILTAVAFGIGWPYTPCLAGITVFHFDGRIEEAYPGHTSCYLAAQGFINALGEGDHVFASGDVRSAGTALFLIPWSDYPVAAVWTKPDKTIALTADCPVLGVQFWNSDWNDGLGDIYVKGESFTDWVYVGTASTFYNLPWPNGQDNYALIVGLPLGQYRVKVVADHLGQDLHLESFCATGLPSVPEPTGLILVLVGSICAGSVKSRSISRL